MPMPLDMESKTQWNITATSLTVSSRSLYHWKEKLNYVLSMLSRNLYQRITSLFPVEICINLPIRLKIFEQFA